VIALVISILILAILPISQKRNFRCLTFYPISKFLFWSYIRTAILLTWIGGIPVEDPYIIIGQLLTLFYFSFFLTCPLANLLWDKIIEK
jgi:ubiquinol-cytochrome c reductase cytochrome b subunit